MNLGLFTGDPSYSKSYLYGEHWSNLKSYKVVIGNDEYNHRFGGNDWKVPFCENCSEPYHQLFTFDLKDVRLESIGKETELPLVSCLNCSSLWEKQIFGIDFGKKEVVLLENNDVEFWSQEDAELRVPVPLPLYPVKLLEMDNAENPMDEESYNRQMELKGVEYLCRLLGAPLLTEGPIDIECPRCKNDMVYIASVFSEEFESENTFPDVAFEFGEAAVYFHYCTHCQIMKVESQGA